MIEKAAPPRFTHYLAEVTRVRRIGTHFVRVTFGGPGLTSFECTGVAPKIKVFVPAQPRTATIDTPIEELLEGSIMRTYTVREHRVDQGEVDIDFVIHPEGPAGRWAEQARLGQTLVISNAAGREPITATSVLLIGDPSAVPAVMSIAEALPNHSRARIILRVDTEAEIFDLEAAADGITRWITTARDPETLTRFVTQAIAEDRPDFVWAAGEASTLKPLRRYLRGDAGFTKETSHTVGYWRRDSTADTYDAETIALASQMLNDGHPLTPQDMDELSIDVGQKDEEIIVHAV